MDWWLSLSLILGTLLVLLLAHLPVAFCFLFLNIVFAYTMWGGGSGLEQIVLSMYATIGYFVLSPVVLFILMGEILFQSGIAFRVINTIDKLMGRMPGRLALISIFCGTLFGAFSGSSAGSAALLGTMLLPEMEKHGYKKTISLGSVMSAGGLAIVIPPSAMAILIGALTQVSIGQILISGVLPGILLAFFYIIYIIGTSIFQPYSAPNYEVSKRSLSEQLSSVLRDVLPFGIIILATMGSIFLGIATPTESAAFGALASFILAAYYRQLKWGVVKKAVNGTVSIVSMIIFIIGGALAFSQILAYSGSAQGMIKFILSLNLPPLGIIVVMMVAVLLLGSIMDSAAILMIITPLFMPIVRAIGFDPLLFCLLILVNIETGFLTPPFGIILFVMKGIAPPGNTMGDIYKASIPFVLCNILVIVVIVLFPQIALWLPQMMGI